MRPLKIVPLPPATLPLCGRHGMHHSMVEKECYLCTFTGRIKLTQRLPCANCSVYVASCLLCKEQYVGQT